ncbi:MAG TPA: ABC transporter substrate-binding protein [Gaiellaceae bacterium]|nr:ABC transporter substrate-binding protein [Gaiellaceae bacterium]
MRKRWIAVAALVVLAAALAVIVGRASSASASAKLTPISIQLQWVPQAQFAGYFAAQQLGYYKAAGLDVKLLNGGPQIVPGQVVAGGRAQFGVNWLTALLAARDTGTNLVDIAQIFSRSGMTELTWKSSGINSVAKMRGKKVANWLGGDQYELFAALTAAGMDPAKNKGVTIVQQPFDMGLFLDHKVDAASAMTYNELAQVLETKNPKTGKLYSLSDLNVLKMQSLGFGMLEDNLFSTASYLKSKEHQQIAEKVIGATLAGWIYCRDHVKQCVNFTLKAGPTLPAGHQTWMMNEINKLIWPSKDGIGIMDPAAYKRTWKLMLKFGGIKKPPTAGAYRTDLARAAVAGLKKQGLDVYGKNYKPVAVKLTPGGK